jgi:hypothetical protein
MRPAGRQSMTKVACRRYGVNFALFDDLIRTQEQRPQRPRAGRVGKLFARPAFENTRDFYDALAELASFS